MNAAVLVSPYFKARCQGKDMEGADDSADTGAEIRDKSRNSKSCIYIQKCCKQESVLKGKLYNSTQSVTV